jgi:hypothetical protein
VDENLIIASPVASQGNTGNKEIISDAGGSRTYATVPPEPAEKNMYGEKL